MNLFSLVFSKQPVHPHPNLGAFTLQTRRPPPCGNLKANKLLGSCCDTHLGICFISSLCATDLPNKSSLWISAPSPSPLPSLPCSLGAWRPTPTSSLSDLLGSSWFSDGAGLLRLSVECAGGGGRNKKALLCILMQRCPKPRGTYISAFNVSLGRLCLSQT